MKLKNVKKLLGDEVYPLWLENFIEHSPTNEQSWQDWVKDMKIYGVIAVAFPWCETPQGREYWLNVGKKVRKNRPILPWWIDRRPDEELLRTDYKKSFLFRKEGGRTCIAYLMHDNSMRVHAGYFKGTLEEFENKAYIEYGDDETRNYAKHIAWLKDLQSNNSNN